MNRNRRILAIIILIAGFLLLGLVGLLYLRNGGGGGETVTPSDAQSETSEEGEGGEPVGAGSVQDIESTPAPVASDYREVVISIQTLPRGYQITGDELEVELRLASEIDANVITSREEAIGLYVRHDVFQGETLTNDALVRDITAIGREDFGPSSLIPFGAVAQAVPMDRLSSVAYGLSEGDSIDIMLSFSFAAIDEQFRTLLRNSLTFYMEIPNEDGTTQRSVFLIDPYGRFEELPTGDLAHIAPSEAYPRPMPVSMIIQNAKVVQVGPWTPPEPPQPPTPTPDPSAPTPTPGAQPPTPTPPPPDVLLLALPPQQQLLLKYALENGADVDFALRAAGDGQISDVVNVDLNYLLSRFNIEIPPDTSYEINPERYLPRQEEPGLGE